MLIPRNIRFFAPEGKETAEVETGVVEKPKTATPPQEELEEEEKPHLDEKAGKNGKKEELPKEDDDELEIEGMEESSDGRIQYTVGNSVYISAKGTKGNRAVSDVLRQEREATSKKDEAYAELKKKSSKEKAAAAIRTPKETDEEDKPPALPAKNDIIARSLTQRGLIAGMERWDDAKWIAYQEQNELKDWQISKLQRQVEDAVTESNKSADDYLKVYNNHIAFKEAEASVRDMLSEVDGIEPNDYAEEYASIVRKAKKDGLNAYGEVSATWIVREMGKVVARTLNSRQKSQLREQVEKEIAENKERRRLTKPPTDSSGKFKQPEKKIMSIAEATRMIMDEERKRAQG